MKRFARPRVVAFDDPAYLRHVAQMKLERANNRPVRPPAQRDLFGGEAEAVVRRRLADRFELDERRILEYDERIGPSMLRKYRELDALSVDAPTAVQVWEIKAGRRPGSLHRALRQLRETKAILLSAFRSIRCGIVFVDIGTAGHQKRQLGPSSSQLLPHQATRREVTKYPRSRAVCTGAGAKRSRPTGLRCCCADRAAQRRRRHPGRRW